MLMKKAGAYDYPQGRWSKVDASEKKRFTGFWGDIDAERDRRTSQARRFSCLPPRSARSRFLSRAHAQSVAGRVDIESPVSEKCDEGDAVFSG